MINKKKYVRILVTDLMMENLRKIIPYYKVNVALSHILHRYFIKIKNVDIETALLKEMSFSDFKVQRAFKCKEFVNIGLYIETFEFYRDQAYSHGMTVADYLRALIIGMLNNKIISLI